MGNCCVQPIQEPKGGGGGQVELPHLVPVTVEEKKSLTIPGHQHQIGTNDRIDFYRERVRDRVPIAPLARLVMDYLGCVYCSPSLDDYRREKCGAPESKELNLDPFGGSRVVPAPFGGSRVVPAGIITCREQMQRPLTTWFVDEKQCQIASRCRYCGLSHIHHRWTREWKQARFSYPGIGEGGEYVWMRHHAPIRCPLHKCRGMGCGRVFVKAEEDQDLCAFCIESLRCKPWWKMARWHIATNTYVDEVRQALQSSPEPWKLASKDAKGNEGKSGAADESVCLYYIETWATRIVKGKSGGSRTESYPVIQHEPEQCDQQVIRFLSRIQSNCGICHQAFCVPHYEGGKDVKWVPPPPPLIPVSVVEIPSGLMDELKDAARRTTTPAVLFLPGPAPLVISPPFPHPLICGFCLVPEPKPVG